MTQSALRALSCVCLLASCWTGVSEAAGPPGEGGAPPSSPVKVAASEERSLAASVQLVGTAEAWHASNISAEVEGPVVKLSVQEGDRVRKGDLLVVVRRVPFELEVREVEATLEATRARLDEAADDLRRTRQLRDEKVVSDRALVVSELTSLSLEREVLRLEAALIRARDKLERASVRAPFTGVVTEVQAELGQWVREGDVVARLVALGQIEVTVPLPERYARDVKPGDRVSVLVPQARSEPYQGSVRAVVPEANPRARTFPLIIDIDNADGAIRSGTTARVEVAAGGVRSGVVVPKDAVVSSPMGSVVFVVKDGRASMRPVQPGVQVEGFVEVGGSVRPGELVVIRGNERLMDGMAVRVVE